MMCAQIQADTSRQTSAVLLSFAGAGLEAVGGLQEGDKARIPPLTIFKAEPSCCSFPTECSIQAVSKIASLLISTHTPVFEFFSHPLYFPAR